MQHWILWCLLLSASFPRAASAQTVDSRLRTDGFYYCAEEDRIQDTEWHNNKPLIFSGKGHYLLSIVVFYPDGGSMFDFWELPEGTTVNPADFAGQPSKTAYGNRFLPRSWGAYTEYQDTVTAIRKVNAGGFDQYIISDLFKVGEGNTLLALKKTSRRSRGREVSLGNDVVYTSPMVFRFVPFASLPQEKKPKRPALLSASGVPTPPLNSPQD